MAAELLVIQAISQAAVVRLANGGLNMNYAEKLKDPRWQKKRLEIFERDGWKCMNCGDSAMTLHVHHRLYMNGRDPWDYPEHYLSTLCEHCHGKDKDTRPQIESILLEITRLRLSLLQLARMVAALQEPGVIEYLVEKGKKSLEDL